ncbi:hypothetical protein [Streptomyces sp. NPDC058653]|uniref:hypothetical protein n=1 Tax=Streptomyces sp. NPDC058653 TaxID=3346576 RepID=UPI00365960B0
MNPAEEGPAKLLGLLQEHLGDIRAEVTGAQYELLLTNLRALADTPQDDPKAVRRAFQTVRLCLLDMLPSGHPVRGSLDSLRFTGTAAPDHRVVLRTGQLVALLRADPPPPPPHTASNTAGDTAAETPADAAPDAAAVIAAVERRLLDAPALSATEVRARYHGSAPPPELIRIADPALDLDPGLAYRYPEFQFRPGGGAPYEVVLEVNRVLLADADPWGAADWWLTDNAWLGGRRPAALLGERPDSELVGAAVALVEGV